MIKSRCHQADVYVYCANEGTSFYVCGKCGLDCDTVMISTYQVEGYHHDTGRTDKIKNVTGAA